MRMVRISETESTTMLRSILSIVVFVGLFHFLSPKVTFAQGETTSAIVGQVSDATGAAIPGATVTITNRETGLQRTAKTDDEGRFNFPQLKPGTYSVKVEAEGFDPQQNDNVSSGLGQKQTVNFTLKVAQSNQTVEVSGAAPLINPENANTSTNLNAPALENLPNPGGDLTYPLQFAAGALVNTAGSGNDFVGGTNGYGNVEFNGLPALSNGYIVDGLETNDPLTNLNSGLSTNLVLGLNSISEVTVNTLSYAVDQGRYGASQVNYVTKSGSNEFHGNLYELWNGSRFNAADYFTNATPGNHKPRSTVNHFGGSVGGPIVRNKLFFFFDSEWVRIALPIVTATTVPTSAFQNYVLQQLPLGGTDSVTGSSISRHRSRCRSIRRCFRSMEIPTERPSPCWAVRSMLAEVRPPLRMMETAARIARASLIRAMIMNRSRRFESITTSMRKTPRGFAFRRTPGSRPPTPILSTRCSTLFPPNPCIRLRRDIRTSFRRIS